jgi:gamma-glutamyltranspeptidase/glutathione hydrolase
MFIENDDWEDSSPTERAHLMAEIAGRAYAARNRWLRKGGTSAVEPTKLVSESNLEEMIADFQSERHRPMENTGGAPVAQPGKSTGTSFVVVDRRGSAVACTLTLNNLFGVGRVAQGMGILLAGLPGPLGRGPNSTAAALLINNVHNVFYYAAAASGGDEAPSALAGVTARTILGKEEEDLETAIAGKRLHNNGQPDVTYYEKGLKQTIIQALEDKGHRLNPVQSMGLVNAVFCIAGIPNKEIMSCATRNDPRGFGLAAGAE